MPVLEPGTKNTQKIAVQEKEREVIIDCSDCEMHKTEHCKDCFVMALLSPKEGPIEIDEEERAAIETLQEAGLAPVLKFRRKAS